MLEQITCSLVAASFDQPQAVLLLKCPDESVKNHLTRLLKRVHNGTATFSGSVPVAYFGDTNIEIHVHDREDDSSVLLEVLGRGSDQYLTFDFVLANQVSREDLEAFDDLFSLQGFFYLLPGVENRPDFESIILPKYQYIKHYTQWGMPRKAIMASHQKRTPQQSNRP